MSGDLRCYVGDRFFIDMAILDALKRAREEFGDVDGPMVIDCGRDGVDRKALMPLLIPSIFLPAKVIAVIDPPKDVMETLEAACGENSPIFAIIGIDSDDYDKRLSILKKMEKDGRVFVYGYIQASTRGKFNKSIAMMKDADGVEFTKGASDALFEGVPKILRKIKSGKSKSDKLTHRLTRVRSELLKAQAHRGFGEKVREEDVFAVLSKSGGDINTWDLVSAITSGDVDESMRLMGKTTMDEGTSRLLLGAVASEVRLINLIADAIELRRMRADAKLILGEIGGKMDGYELWEPMEGSKKKPAQSWYRIKKLLEKRGSSVWKNRAEALDVCADAYRDARLLSPRWRDIVGLLALRMSRLGEE